MSQTIAEALTSDGVDNFPTIEEAKALELESEGEIPSGDVEKLTESLGEGWLSLVDKANRILYDELPKLIGWYDENAAKLSELSGQTGEFNAMSFVAFELLKDGGEYLNAKGVRPPDLDLEGLHLSEAVIALMSVWNPIKKYLPRRVQKMLSAWMIFRWFGKGLVYSVMGLDKPHNQNTLKKGIVDALFELISEFYPPKIVIDLVSKRVLNDVRAEKFAVGLGTIFQDNYGNDYEVTAPLIVTQMDDGLISSKGKEYELKYNHPGREYYIGASNGTYFILFIKKKIPPSPEIIAETRKRNIPKEKVDAKGWTDEGKRIGQENLDTVAGLQKVVDKGNNSLISNAEADKANAEGWTQESDRLSSNTLIAGPLKEVSEAEGWRTESQRLGEENKDTVDNAGDVIDFIPILGDIKAAWDLTREFRKDPLNWGAIAALSAGVILNFVPVVGDAAALAIKRAVLKAGRAGKLSAEGVGKLLKGAKDGDDKLLKSIKEDGNMDEIVEGLEGKKPGRPPT